MNTTGTQFDGESVVQDLAYMWFVPSDSAVAFDTSNPGPVLAVVRPPSVTSMQRKMACGSCRQPMLPTQGTLTCSNPPGEEVRMSFLEPPPP